MLVLVGVKGLPPITDQYKISPHNINAMSRGQVMRIKKNMNLGILNYPIPNSPNYRQLYKNLLLVYGSQ